MANIEYDGKELKLDEKTEISADDALQELENVAMVLIKRVPGMRSIPASLAFKAAAELLHWMYKPAEHPRPSVIMKEIVDQATADLALFAAGSGEKEPIIN